MKYLKNRSNYLQIIKERRDLQTEEKINLLLENQAGSGVMGNEIKWGDCLLGRFLHNTIRKAQIGANLARMRPVISRLRGAMDDLLVSEQLNDLSEVDKAELNKALASEYIDVLRQAIDDFATAPKNSLYYELKSINDLTSDTIENLKGTTATPYLGTGFEGKNEILRQLQKFKEEIDKWIEYEVPDSSQQAPVPQPPNQQQQQQVNPQQAALNAYHQNFLALLYLLLEIQKLNSIIGLQIKNSNIEKQKAQKEQEMAAAANPGQKQQLKQEVDKLEDESVKVEAEIQRIINEKVEFLLEDEKVDKKYQELLAAWKAEQKKAGKPDSNPPAGTERLLRRNAESEVNKTEPQPTANPTKKSEPGQATAFLSKAVVFNTGKKLWSLISSVLGKEDTIKSLSDYIKNFDDYKDEKQINAQIRKIYDTIRKEKGLSNEVVKESIEQIFNDTEKIAVGVKALYEVIKARKGEVSHVDLGLQTDPKTGKLPDDIQKRLDKIKPRFVKFYETMESCLVKELYKEQTNVEEEGQSQPQEKEEGQGQSQAQPQAQKESKLFKYSDFILEYLDGINKKGDDDLADDPDKQHPIGDNRGKRIYTVGQYAKNDDRGDLSVDLKSEWNKVFPNLSRYVISGKAQINQLKETLDKKLASQKDSIIIMGMDPVLEIVKCFNRAYKIHTTQVIPSGRTGGEVTNKIFMQYTCFGSGTPQNAGAGGGPYRNNKLFDLWESSVLDIMKDKQYQKIFNNATRLKVGDEYIEKAGANLRKFMNDMLNGDELYGKGDGKEGGVQAKFLDKYFGYKDGDDAKNTNFGGTEEREVNMANTPEPMKIVLEDADSKARDVKNLKDLVGTFFAVKMNVEGYARTKTTAPSTFYFFIQDVDANNNLYVSFVQTGYFMKEYLAGSGQTVTLGTNINKEEFDTGSDPWPILASKTKLSNFFGTDGKAAKSKFRNNISYIIKTQDTSNSTKPRNSNDTKRDDEAVSGVVFKDMKIYHVIDESKDDRAKVSRMGKVDLIVEREKGAYLNSSIQQKVNAKNVSIPQ